MLLFIVDIYDTSVSSLLLSFVSQNTLHQVFSRRGELRRVIEEIYFFVVSFFLFFSVASAFIPILNDAFYDDIQFATE